MNRITATHVFGVLRDALLGSKQKIGLGRWNLNNNNRNLLATYSNEDHCGTCAQYSHIKLEEIKKNNINMYINENKKNEKKQ
jgi:hypothetical protein